ncbi:MAG: CsgG/HfaB family protein [candidate division Zixibacteria bacterium]|nr:CsgG/HfaB family protein [candidate division Zixibacteria bacterium]
MTPNVIRMTGRLAIGLVVLLAGLTAFPAAAQTEGTVSDKLSEAIALYTNLEFDKGIDLAQQVLARPDVSSKDSVAIYAVISMLTYGKGEQYITKSYEYLDRMAGLGPCRIHLPYEFWPQQLRDRWFSILQTRNLWSCPEDKVAGVTTIAVLEFDNYSVGKYQEELGFITKGLADFFESDFAQISELKVLERDKIDYILREVEMVKSGAVDPATAVKIGRMMGAQVMVFGSITQLDDKKTKMLVKAVRVESSEIIATVEKTGKPEYFEMEKELVKELAEKLDIILNPKTKNLIDKAGTTSADAATLYSQGLYYMDQYDYKKAYDFFKQAYEKDKNFAEAKRKMDIYRPLATS